MEKWLNDMGFQPNDMDNFKELFKKCCKPSVKDIWNHIIHHVRPRNEVQMIKKQCLLHKMLTSKDISEYQVHLNSIKELSIYNEKKREEYNLNKVLKEIEKKKESIREHMKKLELSGLSIKDEEELFKEKVYKLDQFRKKSITVKRVIDKIVDDTKLLQLITKEPYKCLGLGPDITQWEQSVLMTVKELPKGSECQTILQKMVLLAKESELPPVPYWDRTEVLSLLENNLISMIGKLDIYKSKLQEEEFEVRTLKNEIITGLSQCDIVEEDAARVIEECETNHLESAKSVGKELISSEPSYTLGVQDLQIRSLQRQIDNKIIDISDLLPIVPEEISNELELSKVALDHLPMKLPVEDLLNSVAKEVSLFSKIRLNDFVGENRKYVHIHLDLTSESQLKKLKQKLEHFEALLSFENAINLINLPPAGEDIYETFRAQSDDFDKKINEAILTFDGLLTDAKVVSNKVEEGFNFLKKEPLNEKLTGMEIKGKDISYWLKKYKDTKQRLEHEELVQKTMQQRANEPN